MVYAWLMGLGGWMGVAGSLSLLNHRIFSEHTKLSRTILFIGPFLGGTLGYGVSYILSKLLAIQVEVLFAMGRLDVALPLCILIPIITFLTGPLFFVTTILDFASSFSPKRGDTGGTDSIADSTVQPSAPLPVIAESTSSSETVSSSEPVANVSGPTGPSESVETVSGPTGPSESVETVSGPTGPSESVETVSGPTGSSESVETVSGPSGPTEHSTEEEVDYSTSPVMEDLD